MYKLKIHAILSLLIGLSFLTGCVQNQTDNTVEETTISKKDTIAEVQHPQLDLINETIAQDSTNAELYFSRGLAHQKLMNYQSAAADFEKAILLNDTASAYYLNLAALFVEGKNIIPAINVLSKGIEKQPKDINMLLGLSKYYLYIDDTEKSIKMANAVLQQDVTNPDAYFNKGLAYSYATDTMKAISTFQTATEQNPDYYEAYIQLGILCTGKKMKLAEAYYQNALRIKPESIEAVYGLGMHHQTMDNYEAAKTTYRSLIAIDTQFKDAYYNLGYLYFQQDSLTKALKHFDMAANVDVGFARAYYMRGLTYEAMGDSSNALKDYNRTLSLNPQFEKARQGLTRIK